MSALEQPIEQAGFNRIFQTILSEQLTQCAKIIGEILPEATAQNLRPLLKECFETLHKASALLRTTELSTESNFTNSINHKILGHINHALGVLEQLDTKVADLQNIPFFNSYLTLLACKAELETIRDLWSSKHNTEPSDTAASQNTPASGQPQALNSSSFILSTYPANNGVLFHQAGAENQPAPWATFSFATTFAANAPVDPREITQECSPAQNFLKLMQEIPEYPMVIAALCSLSAGITSNKNFTASALKEEALWFGADPEYYYSVLKILVNGSYKGAAIPVLVNGSEQKNHYVFLGDAALKLLTEHPEIQKLLPPRLSSLDTVALDYCTKKKDCFVSLINNIPEFTRATPFESSQASGIPELGHGFTPVISNLVLLGILDKASHKGPYSLSDFELETLKKIPELAGLLPETIDRISTEDSQTTQDASLKSPVPPPPVTEVTENPSAAQALSNTEESVLWDASLILLNLGSSFIGTPENYALKLSARPNSRTTLAEYFASIQSLISKGYLSKGEDNLLSTTQKLEEYALSLHDEDVDFAAELAELTPTVSQTPPESPVSETSVQAPTTALLAASEQAAPTATDKQDLIVLLQLKGWSLEDAQIALDDNYDEERNNYATIHSRTLIFIDSLEAANVPEDFQVQLFTQEKFVRSLCSLSYLEFQDFSAKVLAAIDQSDELNPAQLATVYDVDKLLKEHAESSSEKEKTSTNLKEKDRQKIAEIIDLLPEQIGESKIDRAPIAVLLIRGFRTWSGGFGINGNGCNGDHVISIARKSAKSFDYDASADFDSALRILTSQKIVYSPAGAMGKICLAINSGEPNGNISKQNPFYPALKVAAEYLQQLFMARRGGGACAGE